MGRGTNNRYTSRVSLSSNLADNAHSLQLALDRVNICKNVLKHFKII